MRTAIANGVFGIAFAILVEGTIVGAVKLAPSGLLAKVPVWIGHRASRRFRYLQRDLGRNPEPVTFAIPRKRAPETHRTSDAPSPRTVAPFSLIAAAFRSPSLTMLYRSNTERVLCPVLHGQTLGNTGSDHVAHGRPPEVVRNPTGAAGRTTRRLPPLAVGYDLFRSLAPPLSSATSKKTDGNVAPPRNGGIRHVGPGRDWFNTRPVLEGIGYIPPVVPSALL